MNSLQHFFSFYNGLAQTFPILNIFVEVGFNKLEYIMEVSGPETHVFIKEFEFDETDGLE